MSLLYRLFGIPRTTQEFVEKSHDQRMGIVISYETRQRIVTPEGTGSPYMPYDIFLVLNWGAFGSDQKRKESGRGWTFRLELESGTKTQFPGNDPLLHEALDAVQKVLPEIIHLCNKHQVPYHLDGKTTNLLMSHSQQ